MLSERVERTIQPLCHAGGDQDRPAECLGESLDAARGIHCGTNDREVEPFGRADIAEEDVSCSLPKVCVTPRRPGHAPAIFVLRGTIRPADSSWTDCALGAEATALDAQFDRALDLSEMAQQPGEAAQIAAIGDLAVFTTIMCILHQLQETAMATYSTSDLSRRSGDIIAEALRRPVTIVQRKKPRLVLLSFEDYRKLVARADTRKAGTLDDMPDALFEEFRQAVDAYEREDKKR